MSLFKIRRFVRDTINIPIFCDELYIFRSNQKINALAINVPVTVRKKLVIEAYRTYIGVNGNIIFSPGCQVYWRGTRIHLKDDARQRYLLPLCSAVKENRFQWIKFTANRKGLIPDDYQRVTISSI